MSQRAMSIKRMWMTPAARGTVEKKFPNKVIANDIRQVSYLSDCGSKAKLLPFTKPVVPSHRWLVHKLSTQVSSVHTYFHFHNGFRFFFAFQNVWGMSCWLEKCIVDHYVIPFLRIKRRQWLGRLKCFVSGQRRKGGDFGTARILWKGQVVLTTFLHTFHDGNFLKITCTYANQLDDTWINHG